MTTSAKAGILCLLIPLCSALSPASGSSDAAFQVLKSLEGKWSIQSDGKTLPIQMSYAVGSKGSIVTEQFGKELSVFYQDGDSVAMIHFCNAGNQPRLRLKETNRPGFFRFEMFDITNLKSANAHHVERIIYTILDEKKIELEIVWDGDKSQTSEKYTLIKS